MELRRVADIDLSTLTQREFHPSPAAWEDEVLYFLLVDRFDDGLERPLITAEDRGNAVGSAADADRWRDAGATWCGGNLGGIRRRLGYLARLGVTAVWISPILKQVPSQDTYHGYGTQNFLDVDPHFGTARQLRELVAEAHEHGIRVVLDVVFNHAGDVFGYEPDNRPVWMGSAYDVRGFRDADGKPTLPFASCPEAWPDGAVWPEELQRPGTFSAKGRIVNWDRYPEYLEGDFAGLKDINLGRGPIDRYQPSPALQALTRAYQYWIAFADLDGFRVDTVKHMDPGAARYFASAIHEFAQSIGKERFYLIAEITGDRAFAYRTLEEIGMDAALGLADVQDRLERVATGEADPREYFDLFRNSLQVGRESHTWFRDKVVTGYDDHDQVRKGPWKARFASDHGALTTVALALNATTLGIPCVYYGSEQLFDGAGGDDRYLREAMFGGEFGPFRSRGVHAFDESHPVYQELAKILDLRKRTQALRRGRQYLRPRSTDGVRFEPPTQRGLIPWSRIFADHEVLIAVNTDQQAAHTAWVTVDDGLHAAGDTLTCRYSTDHSLEGSFTRVERRNGKAVEITVPPAGVVIYE
ncbi:alpha-amylase family glycosyl hydrolase [Dactylosporangium sp. AC04546]|uniref:alpha-amylase family glycosyl hydrolase n=1 Tax=Dactylosporangium sp. AC04546 TaxID=2862460 RepID=UPI001EDD3790|nr:alpha-amylase family glycosyl hydrolase [Dactylosporangium sp. AC04546]WVK85555.1 alpha-amylase family glycosyl hydrolase [Dactylosporangium sp. AC04546]